MRSEFNRVYRNLDKHYRIENAEPGPEEDWDLLGKLPAREPSSLEMVNNAIGRAIHELDLRGRIREDGLHFLLVNMHQMIAVPLLHPIAPPIDRDQLQRAMENDVIRILTDSSTAESRYEGISGHRILDSLAKLWDTLDVTQWDFWG